MKKILFAVISIVAIVAGSLTYRAMAKRQFPVIKDYGVVYEVPFAVERPDTDLDYKIIVDVGEKNEKPGEIYLPLEHVSRMYNLYSLAGIPRERVDMAIAIWGEPINVVLNNGAYHKKFGVDNPNIEVLSEMKKAGIKIFGCGQSIMRMGIDEKDINPDVTVALSRVTVVSNYEMKGYAYFKY